MAELEASTESMRPQLAVNVQTRASVDFITGEGGPAIDRAQARLGRQASMSLMPSWAQRLVGVEAVPLVRRSVLDPWNHLDASVLRWAYGTPAWRWPPTGSGRATRRAR